MLKPAICYKEEIENALKEYFYSDDMMFYQGCVNSYLIQIEDCGENGIYQYAVLGANGKLAGYIDFSLCVIRWILRRFAGIRGWKT